MSDVIDRLACFAELSVNSGCSGGNENNCVSSSQCDSNGQCSEYPTTIQLLLFLPSFLSFGKEVALCVYLCIMILKNTFPTALKSANLLRQIIMIKESPK